MTANIEWSEPPPKGSPGAGRTQKFVEVLKQRPGEWAKYPSALSHGATSTYAKNNPGTEWTSRSRPDGRFDMWGRWIGETS